MTADQAEQGFDAVLAQSVRRHIVADVPFGAFCSGGIDSTAVLIHMQRILGPGITAFCIGFRDPAYDESSWASAAAERCGVKLITEYAEPSGLELIPALIRHHGEPFADSSSLPTWQLAKLARCHVPMVLSGDGGDELLAGYHSYPAWTEQLSNGDPRPLWRRIVRGLLEIVRPDRYPKHRPGVRSAENWHDIAAIVPWWLRRRMNRHRDDYRRVPEALEQRFESASDLDPLTQAQHCDLGLYMPDSILAKVDIASMMHGLEVRVPLLDLDVVEFALTIPPHLRFHGTNGKIPLKRIVSRSFDDGFVNRRKQGFSVPLSQWFGGDAAWKTTIHERLLDRQGPLTAWLDPDGIATAVHHGSSSSVYSLIMLDEWLRQESMTE